MFNTKDYNRGKQTINSPECSGSENVKLCIFRYKNTNIGGNKFGKYDKLSEFLCSVN